MTLRHAVAKRVELVAGLRDLATFLTETPDPDGLLTNAVFTLTYPVRSKAEADKIIEAYAPASRPLWRNGVYMAELEPARLPLPSGWHRMVPFGLLSELSPDGGEPECDGVIFEMHFVPPIAEQAA